MAIFNKSTLRQQFTEVTGASVNEANEWLEKTKWKVPKAIDLYLKHMTESKDDPRVIHIFDQFKEDGKDTIEIDGTLLYLEALGVEPEDPETLILAYFLESPSMGVFTKDGFVQNWTKAGAFDFSSMKSYLNDQYKKYQTEPEYFQKVYNFTFGFLMENPGQKLLPTETAIDYWKLLLLSRKELEPAVPKLNLWLDFVEKEYPRGFSRDTWTMFLPFVLEVIVPDPEHMSGYDEMAAWPSVVDEFIEWLRDTGSLA